MSVAQSKAASRRWDSVRTDGLRAELNDCCERFDVTLDGIASRTTLHPVTVRQIAGRRLSRVSRAVAEQLVAAMDAIEGDATGIEWDVYLAGRARRRGGAPRLPHVAVRRRQVAAMSAAGMTVRTIAERLGVPEHTVERDRSRIREQEAA